MSTPWRTKNGSLIRSRAKSLCKVECKASVTKYCAFVISWMHWHPSIIFSTIFEPWKGTLCSPKLTVPLFSIPIFNPLYENSHRKTHQQKWRSMLISWIFIEGTIYILQSTWSRVWRWRQTIESDDNNENCDDDNENYDDNDDNISLMQEHFATVHLDENKQQLYGKMKIDQQRQQHQAVMPLLTPNPVKRTQPTHAENKLNDDDHSSRFRMRICTTIILNRRGLMAPLLPLPSRILLRYWCSHTKKHYDCQRGWGTRPKQERCFYHCCCFRGGIKYTRFRNLNHKWNLINYKQHEREGYGCPNLWKPHNSYNQ